ELDDLLPLARARSQRLQPPSLYRRGRGNIPVASDWDEPGDARRSLAERRDRRLGVRPALGAPDAAAGGAAASFPFRNGLIWFIPMHRGIWGGPHGLETVHNDRGVNLFRNGAAARLSRVHAVPDHYRKPHDSAVDQLFRDRHPGLAGDPAAAREPRSVSARS